MTVQPADLAVKPRRVPLVPDAEKVARATENLRRYGSDCRYPAMVGAFDHIFEMLAVESDARQVQRYIRQALAYLAADELLRQEERQEVQS